MNDVGILVRTSAVEAVRIVPQQGRLRLNFGVVPCVYLRGVQVHALRIALIMSKELMTLGMVVEAYLGLAHWNLSHVEVALKVRIGERKVNSASPVLYIGVTCPHHAETVNELRILFSRLQE